MCGIRALEIIRRQGILLRFRKTLRLEPLDGYVRPGLTNLDLAPARAKKWRCDIAHKFPAKARAGTHPRCILACEALACVGSVEVNPDSLTGLGVSDLDLPYDLLESLTSSSTAFQEFVTHNWDRVLRSAFVYQVQPIDPDFELFVIFAQPVRDGTARFPQVEALKGLRERCGHCRLTIGALVIDGDSGYDAIHQTQSKLNIAAFRRNHDILMVQHFRSISDILRLHNGFKRFHFIVEHGFRWTRECSDFGKIFTIILAIIENKSGARPQMRLRKWFQKVMNPSNHMAPIHSL
jgi:hypothetical protein